jgi:hypothetical protein
VHFSFLFIEYAPKTVSSHFQTKGEEMNTEDKSLLDTYSPDTDLDEFREMIAKNAYYRAEKRGFEDGYELDDWLEAEQEISSQRRYWLR